jgi:electron transport complex protein RnfC
MKTYKFPSGGISFEDATAPLASESVLAFLPNISIVPLKQHAGEAASPVVRVGDTIREGELLARSQGAGSADVHAPLPGKIVQTHSWNLSSMQKSDAYVIKFSGAFEILGKKETVFSWDDLPPFQLRDLIRKAGVVEMSGSGRPLQDMFTEKCGENRTRSLVVRCVFDDPWLAAEMSVCKERPTAVAEGACIAARAAGANRIIIAVSKNQIETGKILLEEAKKWDSTVKLVAVGSRYPQRGRRELEIALRKYERKTIEALGALLVTGTAELAAVYDAVKLRKPLMTRFIAVGGSAVKHPSIINARIGTRIGELFQQCGGFKKEPERIGFGSTLLGRKAVSLDEPVSKTTYAVFAEGPQPLSFLKKFPFMRRGASCINCGLCRTVCPVGLDPDGVYKRLTTSGFNDTYSYLAAKCHGCACCEAVCPSRLPLCTVIKGLPLEAAP